MYKSKEYLLNEYIKKGRSQSNIAKEWNVSPKLINYYVVKNKLNGIKSKRKYTCNTEKFDFTNPIFCYYSGLIATDGYIDLKNNRVSLRLNNKGSKQLLNNLKNYFEFTGQVRTYKGNHDLTITSNELINELKKLNIEGSNKTYDLKFPKLNDLSEDCQLMFMRGVLDGDGNIHVQKSKYSGNYIGGQFRVVTASEDFIQGIIDFLNKKFNRQEKLSFAKVKGVNYPKLEMTVEGSKQFYNWVYQGYEDFRLKDKYSKYLLLLR